MTPIRDPMAALPQNPGNATGDGAAFVFLFLLRCKERRDKSKNETWKANLQISLASNHIQVYQEFLKHAILIFCFWNNSFSFPSFPFLPDLLLFCSHHLIPENAGNKRKDLRKLMVTIHSNIIVYTVWLTPYVDLHRHSEEFSEDEEKRQTSEHSRRNYDD